MTAPSKIHGKTVEAWAKMCLGKNRYSDESGCRASAQKSIQRPASELELLWVYKCPNCKGWHMTRSENDSAPVSKDDVYLIRERDVYRR
jgi:hypothetical protein